MLKKFGVGVGRIVNVLLRAIYDQLSPFYAKYYTRLEAQRLLLDGKFENIGINHRHGYRWTFIRTKP
jgi:hypothetical protein